MTGQPRYKKILLKMSGEVLMGDALFGIDTKTIEAVAEDIKEVVDAGVELCLVVGGGNIFRGVSLAGKGMDRASADYMGMLATVMNGLALEHAVEKEGQPARALSAVPMPYVCQPYSRQAALNHLGKGRVTVLAGGTGNPFFTTDTAASLRSIEINANLLIKATKVDGVYTDDPMKNPDATLYKTLTYDEALDQRLNVMDATALVLCRDHDMPLRVMNVFEPGAVMRTVMGEDIGSLIETETSA